MRTSCTETQVIKVTASTVSPLSLLGRLPAPARSKPPLFLRRSPLTLHHPFFWEKGRVGGERRGGSSRSSKRWDRGEVWKERGGGGKRGGESLSLSRHRWSEVGLEGGDGSPWPPIRLPVASTLYKHSLVPLAWRAHTLLTHAATHTCAEGDLYRQPAERRERERSAPRNRKVHRDYSEGQKVREGEGGRWLLSIPCAPFHHCTSTDLKSLHVTLSVCREILNFAKRLFRNCFWTWEKRDFWKTVRLFHPTQNQVFPSPRKVFFFHVPHGVPAFDINESTSDFNLSSNY